MSDFFSGWVSVGARTSQTNANTSAPADSGVSREVATVPAGVYPAGQPLVAQARADQYRAAVLDGGVSQEEYLVWAANTGPLFTGSGKLATGNGAVTTGTVAVFDTNRASGEVADASPRVVVTDPGGRAIASLLSLQVVRGDAFGTVYTLTLAGGDFTFDVGSGVATLLPTANVLAATTPVSPTAPGLSDERGDRVTSAEYELAEVRFWWTKNDRYATRFAWNAAKQKWLPLRGGAPKNLGVLTSDSGVKYTLTPRPSTPINGYLPGSDAGDAYATIRLGVLPDATSYPVVERTSGDFTGVLVVPDDLANASYDFASVSPPLAGVVSPASGAITWNPAFVQTYAGLTVWYLPAVYEEKSSGVVGELLAAKTEPLFIAPVPGPGERPIIRLGNREPLTVIACDTEAQLLALSVINEGEVGFAISTGRIRLSPADITKADPGTRAVPNPGFDKLWLGAVVRYDGVTGNLYPQPLRAPTLLVDGAGNPVVSFDPSGEVFIPDALGVLGLGVSGILDLPDATGNVPDGSVPVTPRPGDSGLVRALSSGLGDVVLYTDDRAVETIRTVAFEDELPSNPYRISGSTAYVALEKRTGLGSKVLFGSAIAKQLKNKPLYFAQAEFAPATYAVQARLVSRVRDTFTLDGSETLTFSISSVDVTWSASSLGAGIYTASDVAASIDTAITSAGAPGSAYALSGRLVIADDDIVTGTVSVGFTTPDGCRVLGFLPGWCASPPGDTSATDVNWLPDYGGEFGFYRSPRNLDFSQDVPDYRDTYRLDERVLTTNISSTPLQFLDFPPREDIAGYDEGIFFALSAAGAPGAAPTFGKLLRPWEDVQYRFEQSKFAWLNGRSFQGQVESPVASINLGANGVVEETLLAALGGYFRLSATGGPFTYLEPDDGLLLVDRGATGEALLVDRVGPSKYLGYRGTFSAGSGLFTDVSASFTSNTSVGDLLQIKSGDAQGYYLIEQVVSATQLQVSPDFPAGDGGQVQNYLVREGVAPDTINPAVLADVVYEQFNPLPIEPFEIRVLTKLGLAGGTLATADAAKSIERGRPIFARFTQTGNDLPLTVLGSSVLGNLANDVLSVPATGARFTTGSFSVLVGTVEFTNGVDLLPVPAFSVDPGTNIQYLDGTAPTPGLLRFGSAVFASLGGASVTYVEKGLPPASLASGQAEIDPNTGTVYLSQADLTTYAGQPVYYVEQLSCEGTTDMAVNPVLGAFTFLANPIREGQLVEATYFRAVQDSGELFLDADGNPVRVKEFLPLFVRAEVATRISSQLYSFNPTGRTVDQLVSPVVYEGTIQRTYGVPQGCAVNFLTNTISFVKEVPDTAKVTISYAVYEAFGGETAYTVSVPPVWRPPLRIDAGQTQFGLEGDRTADLEVGRLFRLGSFVTYLRAFTYDAAQDATVVTVYPAPKFTAGSLDTGANALSLLTDRPVVAVVDPFGSSPTPVPGNVDGGFFVDMTVAFGLAQTPRFEPVSTGQVEIKFEGNLTKYAVVGHLIELFGYPFAIVKANISDDGRVTTITVGSPFPTAFAWSSTLPSNATRITVRPVYPEGAGTFLGQKFAQSEEAVVVLYGEQDDTGNVLPGRVLALGSDYTLDANGNIAFVAPRQAGIGALQSLQFYRTDLVSVGPFLYQGQVQYPRAAASFGYVDPPSATNGRLGGVLQATYTFESPDAFYTRLVPFQEFSSEVALELQKAATAQEPSFGPALTTGGNTSASANGRVGLVSERMNLVDRDRVARAFLGFYNAVVSAFEQIEETLDGQLIGERNGKLRLRFGKNDPWTPPGYEDEITGEINPRVLWFGAFDAARRGLPVIRLLRADPITDPLRTALDANGRPQGPVQDSASFGRLLDFQATLIQNDIDDVVLVSRGRVERTLAGFIWFKVRAFGNYADLSQPSPYSRVFPERTTAFTTTAPGLDFDEATGAPGVYSAGKFGFDPLGFLYGFPFSIRSTTGTAIGTLENPVLGTVQNVLGVAARDRLARARIWAYSPTGFPDVDLASAGLPSFIATPLPLVDFPLLSDTGLPDVSQLASQSLTPTPTGFNDLATGDPELHTPPFGVGDQLALGVPDGSFTQLGDSGTSFPVGVPPVTRYGGVFVNSVLSGCILTLADESGAVIANPARLVALSGPAAGTPIDPQRGDTIFVVPRTGQNLAVSDPPTIAEVQALSAALPEYRTGTDLNFNARTGELIDATLPSFDDPTPFGLKEITGQRPPAPLSTLEARVSFQNGERLPARIPALDGGKRLDSGDYSLPYYGSPTSELELLGSAAAAIIDLTRSDSPDPPPVTPPTVAPAYVTEAVYPDETLGADGGVKIAIDPSALLTSEDLIRGTSSGAYPPPPGHAGVGDLNQFDLLFIQEGTGTPAWPGGFPAGATGIHTVGGLLAPGAPSLNQIEPPRFTSPMSENTLIDYVTLNAQAWVDYPAYASGVVVRETVVGPVVTTEFIIGSIPAGNIVFDDGAGGGVLPAPVGGWNDVIGWAAKGTVFAFSLIDKTTGGYPFSTVLNKTGGGSGPGASILAGVFTVNIGGPLVPVNANGFYFLTDRVVVITAAPWFDFTPYGSVTPAPGVTETPGFHDFALSALVDSGYTASIDVDRLTWRDHIDFRSALPRGFTHPAGAPGASMECGLSVILHDAEVFPGPVTIGVTFNANTYINAGVPFTFPARSWISPSVNGVGTFSPAPSPGGLGSVRVSGFEQHGNIPIEATGITFSAAASSRQSKTGPIFNGFAFASQIPGPGEYQFVQDNYFALAGSPFAGSVAEIQPGDIAVIKGTVDPAVAPPGTNVSNGKVGTYLVRAAVAETPATLPGHRLDLTASVGSAGAWLDFVFPTVTDVDSGGAYLEATDLLPLAPLSDVTGAPVATSYAFPASGRVYVLLNESDVTVAGSAVSAAYASLDGPNNRFLTLSGFQDGVGGAITLAQFAAAATTGKKISGMTVVPVAPSGDGVPPNLPGFTAPVPFVPLLNAYYFGFKEVSASYNGGAPSTFDSGLGTIVGVPPVPGELGVYQKTIQPSTSFLPLEAPVYREIPGALDLSGFPWAALHGGGPACLFPGDRFDLQYHALAGLFVEPSFPVSGNNLGAPRVNVVDAANSLTASEIGTRSYASYATSLPGPGTSYFELAQLEVRRIRRFHGLLEFAAEALRNLRFVYEIRRGIVASLTTSGTASLLVAEPVDNRRIPSPLPGGTATQLGDFTVPLLNVNGGDTVRFLDADGLPFAEMDVLSVETDGFTLVLSRKAIPAVVPGTRFEVYLRKAPVPHEQSCEELLDLATDIRVLDREANLVTQQGGKVDYVPNPDLQVAYDQSINKLTDTGSLNFVKAGVQVGDILIVDPAGKLRGPTGSPSPSEYGRQAFGDQSVIDRGPGAPYNPGGPSQLDDNRGFYRIKAVTLTQLEVEALGGELGSMRPNPDVVFDASYAVYPTVHGSSLSGAGNDGREGQMDLRPTAFCNGSNSFRGNWFSIAPFSYRVIRPSPFLSETALELILSTRERLLSWMEELRTLFESGKSGTYFVFQRDQHITDLGDPTDPLLGLGVLFDAYIATIAGLVDVSPFTNTSDALSILDRRFWGLDLRLDTLTPPYSPPLTPPYADFANDTGRPVLPDRIEEVLNQSDNLRDSRWSWLTLRTDRVSGTLEAIRRFDRELTRRIAEQKRLLTAVKGTQTR